MLPPVQYIHHRAHRHWSLLWKGERWARLQSRVVVLFLGGLLTRISGFNRIDLEIFHFYRIGVVFIQRRCLIVLVKRGWVTLLPGWSAPRGWSDCVAKRESERKKSLTRGLSAIRKSENYTLGISGGKTKLPRCPFFLPRSRSHSEMRLLRYKSEPQTLTPFCPLALTN